MADERLRRLEQRWRVSGDVGDELRYLRERMRRRTLPRDRLLLAGYLESPAALAILGDDGFPREPSLGTWLRGLGRGRLARSALAGEACLRAALVAVERALPAWERAGHDCSRAREAAAAVEAWLSCPCEEHALRKGMFAGGEATEPPDVAAHHLIRTALADTPAVAASEATQAALCASKALRGTERHHNKAVRLAIRRALIPWVLGTG